MPRVLWARPVQLVCKALWDLLARLEDFSADRSFRAAALSSCQLESAG